MAQFSIEINEHLLQAMKLPAAEVPTTAERAGTPPL